MAVRSTQDQNKAVRSTQGGEGGVTLRDVKKCCKQCGQVKFLAPQQNGPCKNTQNITKHGVYKDATDIKK